MPVYGMDKVKIISLKKTYEDNQKILLLILCGFIRLKLALPCEVTHIIAFDYCHEYYEHSIKLLETKIDQVPSWLSIKSPFSLSDLFFLDKDENFGITSVSTVWFNNIALATRSDLITEQDRQKERERQSSIDEFDFDLAMQVPLALRKKIFVRCDSTVRVFKEKSYGQELELRRQDNKSYYSLELIKHYTECRSLLCDSSGKQ